MDDVLPTTQNDLKPNPSLSSLKTKSKILIVEDEQDAADIFAQLVKTLPNVEVSVVFSGEEAFEITKKTQFDLILLDILLVELSGIDVLAQIKSNPELYGTPKIVMLTNVGGDASISQCMQLGADGYLLKIKIEPEELLQKIQIYLSETMQTKIKQAEADSYLGEPTKVGEDESWLSELQ